jgi:HAD superfamily hydrolase (TIGR01509 family)
MAIKAILFDMDGTLIDTELAAAKAIDSWFKKWGLALDPADAHFVVGRAWNVVFDRLFAKVQLPMPREDAVRQILETYRATLENELPTVPGAVEAVQALAAHYPLGLVSGSYRAQILWALGKLGILGHFQIVLGAEDYPESKPAPDGYLSAIRTLAVAPAQTLIFEDSAAGITSGLAAGAQVVAITGTNHFQQNIAAAHHHIENLLGVTAEWVRNLQKD